MIKNYLSIALRNLWKNKGYAFINISGLSVGLAGFIIIILYVNRELSYDKWDKQLNNVYRVDAYYPQFNMKSDGMTAEEGQLFKNQLPEVNNTTCVGHWYSRNEKLISNGTRRFYDDNIIIADSNFFGVFPYRLIAGNEKTALQTPDAIILSKSLSEKLFGNENPVGRPVRIDEKADYTVSGVFEPPPTPSQLTFDIILSYNQRKISQLGNNISYNTYLFTKPGTDTVALNKQLTAIYATHLANKYGPGKTKNSDKLFVEPIQQIHLHSEMDNHDEWKGMVAASLLSILILLIACINYTNLSVATSFRRAKEMGVRKVMGSSPRQLAVQFLAETLLMCLIAFFIALILAELSLPVFNHILQLDLSLWRSYEPLKILAELIVILLIVTILSGGYPAFVIASFVPARVLKGDTSKNIKGKYIRNVLLVIQFCISVIFIAGMLIIYRQIHYLKTRDVGFNPQQVIAIKTQQAHSFSELTTLKNRLKQFPQVAGISVTSSIFGDAQAFFPYKFKGEDGMLGASYVDNDFFRTLGISLLQGRFFSGSYAEDTLSNVIINETAAKKLGIKRLNGQQVSLPDGPPSTVIGIIKDYDSQGFEEETQPTMYYSTVPAGNVRAMLLVKINTKDATGAVSRLTKAWSSFEPGFPMRYVFLDQEFGKYFIKYQQLGNLFFLFTILSVTIALMGLFALAAFMTAQRTKEIGIRKVLGASLNDILQLLNRDFVRLVLIANVIAWPVTYLLAQRWLNDFAYRIHMPVMAFVLATVASIVITLLTVSLQAWHAAAANPVQSLRTE